MKLVIFDNALFELQPLGTNVKFKNIDSLYILDIKSHEFSGNYRPCKVKEKFLIHNILMKKKLISFTKEIKG
jgi:hypothetical protein